MAKLHKYGDGSTYPVKTGQILVASSNGVSWVSGETISASVMNTYIGKDFDALWHGKEYTCEFCSRANPIANLECERCGAPRKAV